MGWFCESGTCSRQFANQQNHLMEVIVLRNVQRVHFGMDPHIPCVQHTPPVTVTSLNSVSPHLIFHVIDLGLQPQYGAVNFSNLSLGATQVVSVLPSASLQCFKLRWTQHTHTKDSNEGVWEKRMARYPLLGLPTGPRLREARPTRLRGTWQATELLATKTSRVLLFPS